MLLLSSFFEHDEHGKHHLIYALKSSIFTTQFNKFWGLWKFKKLRSKFNLAGYK